MFGLDGDLIGSTNNGLDAMQSSDGILSLWSTSWTYWIGTLILLVILIATGIILFKGMFSGAKLSGTEEDRKMGKVMLKNNMMQLAVVIIGSVAFWALLIGWFGLTL